MLVAAVAEVLEAFGFVGSHLGEELVTGAVGVLLVGVLEPGRSSGGVQDVESGFQADSGGDLGIG